MKVRRAADPEKYKALDWATYLKSEYGVTVSWYDKKFGDQEGKCAICKKKRYTSAGRLMVDHCHDSGAPRGLLCSKCNFAIGLLDDDAVSVDNAGIYLRTYRNYDEFERETLADNDDISDAAAALFQD